MTPLEWNEGLSVRDFHIDEEHRAAVEDINAITHSLDYEPDSLLSNFDRFVDHCREHFRNEERLMEEHGFPQFDVHQSEHHRVLAEMDDIRRRLLADGPGPLEFYFRIGLKSWFLSHVRSMDAAGLEHVNRVRGRRYDAE